MSATRARAPRGRGDTGSSRAHFARGWRIELAGLGILALAAGLFLAWPLLGGAAQRDPSPAAAAARAYIPTAAPATPSGPTPVPTFQPAALTEPQAIEIVANRPINGVAYTSMRQTTDRWSAEYRGDGSWLVHGGDAAWLVFEQSHGSMPANLAAANLESPAGRRTTK